MAGHKPCGCGVLGCGGWVLVCCWGWVGGFFLGVCDVWVCFCLCFWFFGWCVCVVFGGVFLVVVCFVGVVFGVLGTKLLFVLVVGAGNVVLRAFGGDVEGVA
ncbi:hypothetical protein RA264_27935, partial [Pseudomonas syringae pv. tagetis]